MKRAGSSISALSGVLALFASVMQGAPPEKPEKIMANLRAHKVHVAQQSPKAISNYTFTEIKCPDDGGLTVAQFPWDINSSGIVSMVGYQTTGDQVTLLYDNGSCATVRHPGSAVTNMIAANNGRLFGNWGDGTTQTAGVYDLRTDTWTALPDVPGKNVNIGLRMNETGAGVGFACENTSWDPQNCISWVWDPVHRSYRFPNILGDPQAQVFSINNRGQMVAMHAMEYASQSYLMTGGNWQPIQIADAIFVRARDLNDRGEIIMEYLNQAGDWIQAILYKGEVRILNNYPSAWLTGYLAINESGDAVGVALKEGDWMFRTFVATRK